VGQEVSGHDFSRAECIAKCKWALQAAEKGEIAGEFPEKHTSGAKAQVDSIALLPGIKSPAYRTNEFFRILFSP
jgi:hypothetical protein